MAAPRTYTDDQYAAMAELVNDQELTIRETQRTLANGYRDLAPFEPSTDTISKVAKTARAQADTSLDGLELADALDHLGRQSLVLIGRRLAQVHEQPNKFDASETLTIMRALTEAKGLVKPRKTNNQGTEPTFLELVDTPDNTSASANQTPQAGGPVSVRVARGSS